MIIVIDRISGRTVFHNHKNIPKLKIGSINDYTSFDEDGHQTMHGKARSWRDEKNDVLQIQRQGQGISLNVVESTVEYLQTADINDYMYLNVQLNHDKDLTSDIYPHLHFLQEINATPNFVIQYRWQVSGNNKVNEWSNLKCNLLAFQYLSGIINQIAYSLPITVPNDSKLSDIIQFRIFRDTTRQIYTTPDLYTQTVGVLSFDVHFMTNSLGSNEEFIK